jgi:CubicO group peptidase (beta-lactamase class C family)
VEQVSGQRFDKYCEDNIFTALGIETAGWLSTDIDLENMAVQYDAGTRLKPYSYPTYPAGSLKISIQDYSKFLMAMMNGGVYNGRRILKEATVKEMLPDNHENNLVWADNVLGEFFIDAEEYRLQGHTGGDPGSFSVVAFNPENDAAFILFMNGTPPLVGLRILNVRSFIRRIAGEAQLY